MCYTVLNCFVIILLLNLYHSTHRKDWLAEEIVDMIEDEVDIEVQSNKKKADVVQQQ